MKQARLLSGPAGALAATVSVPPSKSVTNRALIVAAAAGGGTVRGPLDADDTRLLAAALDACGWPVRWIGDEVTIARRSASADTVTVNLGNSGTGSRLLLGLLACVPGCVVVVDGSQRLRERPMAPLVDALARLGGGLDAAVGHLPVLVEGRALAGGRLTLSPGASSQFASALLLAAPLMRKGLDLELEGPVPSQPYLELSAAVLRAFGGSVTAEDDGRRWRVAAGGLHPSETAVEGDWSAAAFFLAAAAVAGGRVTVAGVRADSAQGDRAMLTILESAGMRVEREAASVTVIGPVLRPLDADLGDTPDLFPALAVVAAAGPPGSRLTGLRHLRHKESDRLAVMVGHLERLGAGVSVATDASAVDFTRPLAAPGPSPELELTAADDHRVAMALAVAALRVGPFRVDDATCVAKSFPDFWDCWRGLAG